MLDDLVVDGVLIPIDNTSFFKIISSLTITSNLLLGG